MSDNSPESSLRRVSNLMATQSAIDGVTPIELIGSSFDVVGIDRSLVMRILDHLYADEGYPGGSIIAGEELEERKTDILHQIASAVMVDVVDIRLEDSFYNNPKGLRSVEQELKRVSGQSDKDSLAICLHGLSAIYDYDDSDEEAVSMAILKPKFDYSRELSGLISDFMHFNSAVKIFAICRDPILLPSALLEIDVLPHQIWFDRPKKKERQEIVASVLSDLSWDSFYSGDQEVFDILTDNHGVHLLVADFKGSDYASIVNIITESAGRLALKIAGGEDLKITPLAIYQDIFGKS